MRTPWLLAAWLIGIPPQTLEAQKVVTIKIEGSEKSGRFRFNPAQVEARPGDVLKFTVVSGAPHTVVFQGDGLPADVHAALNQAIPNRMGDLRGPMLSTGQVLSFTIPALPPGKYVFYCLIHLSYKEQGELTILPAKGKG